MFPHVQPCPQCPTIAQGQLWENRKFPVSKFWIPVVRFGPPLPFLALSCVQSSPMSGTSRFSHNSTRIIAFRVPDKRETGPEDAWWSRGALTMVPAATTTTGPLQTSKSIKFTKNHQKSQKIIKTVPKPVLKLSHASKIQFWPVKCFCCCPMTTNTPQTIQGAAAGPMVASRTWCRASISVRKIQKFSKIPKSALREHTKNQVP